VILLCNLRYLLKNSSMKRTAVSALVCLNLLLVLPFASASTLSQTKQACSIVNRWPEDYAQGWPIAVKKHNAAPNSVSAASYMNGLTEIYKKAFKISDKNALNILNDYEAYWIALEQDYINGNGKLVGHPASAQIITSLIKYCSNYR
jgi:hypothetical protein